MNNKQKAVILIGVIIIFIMGIFPPFYYAHEGKRWASFGFILNPPIPERYETSLGISRARDTGLSMRIDISQLYVQLSIISLIVIGFVLFFQRKDSAGQ